MNNQNNNHKKQIRYIYFPDSCDFCGLRDVGLSEHHVIRRSQGGLKEKTIFLCYECHNRANEDKAFEINLQKIFL